MGQKGMVPASAAVEQGMAALRDSAAAMGLAIGERAYSVIEAWFDFYSRWPGRRVVGLRDPRDIAVKLIADSFAVSAIVDEIRPGPALDLGSGSGWPGLAVRLCGRERAVTLLDSRLGACEFMRRFVRQAGLQGVSVLGARAEEAAKAPGLERAMALVTARAMALPGISLEIASGFLELGGAAILWLGPSQEGAVDARQDIPELGLVRTGKHGYQLPFNAGKRILAVYTRTCSPLPGYPRRLSSIRSKPLL